MKSAGRHTTNTEDPEPLAQFTRGPGSEGDGEAAPRVMDAREDPVSDAVGDGAGLAGAGPSKDHYGAVERFRDGPLLRIEP